MYQINHFSIKFPLSLLDPIRQRQNIKLWTHTHPSKTAEASQHLAIDEAALCRVGQGFVQQVVDEVDARLHSEDHPLLHQPTHPETLQSRLVDAFHPLDNITI